MAESNRQIWRIIDVLKWSKDYLRDKQVESPQIETEWILREVLGLSRLEIYLRHERPLSTTELARIKALLLKRAASQPIQYVLGNAEFMGLKFKVTPDVLIPRPETELLVEKVTDLCKVKSWSEPHILDIGTGSGCIAVALAKRLPGCQITAVDISPAALAIARENAGELLADKQIDFRQLDILKSTDTLPNGFDVIVSNPPYVAGDWFLNLPKLVKDHEPEIALNPGPDGLLFYRRISEIAPRLCKTGGFVALEIGGDHQAAGVTALFSGNTFTAVEVIKDYAGLSRMVVAELTC
jgi:release factor glutamine methyltransferase